MWTAIYQWLGELLAPFTILGFIDDQ